MGNIDKIEGNMSEIAPKCRLFRPHVEIVDHFIYVSRFTPVGWFKMSFRVLFWVLDETDQKENTLQILCSKQVIQRYAEQIPFLSRLQVSRSIVTAEIVVTYEFGERIITCRDTRFTPTKPDNEAIVQGKPKLTTDMC